jgi:predicted oxidoreductase
MTHPTNPVPILGTGKLERIGRAVAAADVELNRERWYKIWTASMGESVP